MNLSELRCKTNIGVPKFVGVSGSSKDPEQASGVEAYSRTERRKIIRKVDFRIVLPLGLMMAAGFLDRANIGNAAIAG